MKRKLLVPVLAAIVLTFAWPAWEVYLSSSTASEGPAANYRSWRRVTARRARLPKPLFVSCAFSYTPEDTSNPHHYAEYQVYVNHTGERALTSEVNPRYPPGTVIVKEKFVNGALVPNLLTVMRKHDSGYDPANGDWEYLAQQLPHGRLQTPPIRERCRSCHQRVKDQDYVFRGYLPIQKKDHRWYPMVQDAAYFRSLKRTQ